MTRVAIFGAPGYGGMDLLRRLLFHPEVEVTYASGYRTVGQRLDQVYPHLRGVTDMMIEESSVAEAAGRADILVFALSPGQAMDMVAEALQQGKPVLDFSADYRLKDAEVYAEHYQPHTHPELLPEAVYGLPELHRDEIKAARLVAVPGCYSTGAILALAPLLAAKAIDPQGIIVDGKSGVSGVGRTKVAQAYHYPELNETMYAYAVARHRHQPEMEQELGPLCGEEVKLTFVPHVVPITRGIIITAYATLRGEQTTEELSETVSDFYAGERFVRVHEPGEFPETKHVSGTNFTDIGLQVDPASGKVVVVAAVDNLGKGLPCGALQCLNLMIGCEESTCLLEPALWP